MSRERPVLKHGHIEIFHLGDPLTLVIVHDNNQRLVIPRDDADALAKALLSLDIVETLADTMEGALEEDPVDTVAMQVFAATGKIPERGS